MAKKPPTTTTATEAGGWRATLPIHPACELLPELPPDELDELGRDIAAHGLRAPIVVYVDPKRKAWLLDGRSRLDAMERAALPFELYEVSKSSKRHGGSRWWTIRLPDPEGGLDANPVSAVTVYDIDPYDYAISANIRRRHLTSEQKRDLVETLLKRDPSKSNRQIAKTVSASPTFVGKVRNEAEERGDVSTVDTRTDAKGRQQPARKPPPAARRVQYVSKPPVTTRRATVVPYYREPDQPPEVRMFPLTATNVDPEEARLRLTAHEITRSYRTIASALVGGQGRAILSTLDDDERQQLREDIEVADQLKALDAEFERRAVPRPRHAELGKDNK